MIFVGSLGWLCRFEVVEIGIRYMAVEVVSIDLILC